MANNILVEHPQYCDHWSQELGRILEPLGIKHTDVRKGASFISKYENIEYAKNYVRKHNGKYITLNLGTGNIRKNWPVDNFVQIMIKLNIEYGYIPIVITNPGMENLAIEFENKYQKHATVIRLPLLSLN